MDPGQLLFLAALGTSECCYWILHTAGEKKNACVAKKLYETNLLLLRFHNRGIGEKEEVVKKNI